MDLNTKARALALSLQTLLEKAENADHKTALANEELSPQEIRVLRTVGCCEEECPIMSSIANAIRLSLSSVTGLIDRLTAKKLVSRDRSTDDRRIVQVKLTDEGRQLYEAAQEGRISLAKEVLTKLSKDEQDKLIELLTKVSSNLKTET